MNRPGYTTILRYSFLLAVLITSVGSAAEMMGSYFPLNLGATWEYENPDDPFDGFISTVFDFLEYEGLPAYRMGNDIDNYNIISRIDGVLTVHAEVDNGVFYDLEQNIVLGEIPDGTFFEVCFQTPCDSSMIRVWQDVDPSLRSIYDMDPGLTDMLMFVSYDSGHAPNLHNMVAESNLPAEVTPPSGAVVSLEWYLRDVGMIKIQDVDPETGGMTDAHVLVEVSPVIDTPRATSPTMEQNVPNPFNPRTTIGYHLAGPAAVTLAIYDCAGRLVKTLLANELQATGHHSRIWDGTDSHGRQAPSGSYLCRLEADGQPCSLSITLLR